MFKRAFDVFYDFQFWLLAGSLIAGGLFVVALSLQFLDVTYDYTLRSVLLGSTLLGMVTAILGCFATLRRQSLVGDVLAHAALPGVVLGFLVAGSGLSVLLLGAAIAGWVGLQWVSSLLNTTRLKQDTASGIVLATFFGFGIALLSYTQSREDAGRVGLDKFFFGQAATIVGDDVLIISGLALLVLFTVIVFWKELKLTAFDVEFASTNGYAVRRYDILLSSLIVVTVVMGLQIAGVILMVGMLIAPAVAARQWTNNFKEMIILAAIFGAISGSLGAILSSVGYGRPTGPMVIGLASMIAFGSLAIAPARGLFWVWWRQWRDRHQFETENLLGDLYRIAQRHQQKDYAVPETLLVGVRGWLAKLGLRDLQRQGLVSLRANQGWALTETGYTEAENHHQKRLLWELYRLHQQDLPKIEVDYRQDVRDLLPPHALEFLRKKMT